MVNKQTYKILGTVLLLGFVLAVGSIFLGKSDSGQIDVGDTIQTSNTNQVENQENIPVVDTRAVTPNGGLQGKGKVAPPPPVAVEESGIDEEVSSLTDETDSEVNTEEI